MSAEEESSSPISEFDLGILLGRRDATVSPLKLDGLPTTTPVDEVIREMSVAAEEKRNPTHMDTLQPDPLRASPFLSRVDELQLLRRRSKTMHKTRLIDQAYRQAIDSPTATMFGDGTPPAAPPPHSLSSSSATTIESASALSPHQAHPHRQPAASSGNSPARGSPLLINGSAALPSLNGHSHHHRPPSQERVAPKLIRSRRNPSKASFESPVSDASFIPTPTSTGGNEPAEENSRTLQASVYALAQENADLRKTVQLLEQLVHQKDQHLLQKGTLADQLEVERNKVAVLHEQLKQKDEAIYELETEVKDGAQQLNESEEQFVRLQRMMMDIKSRLKQEDRSSASAEELSQKLERRTRKLQLCRNQTAAAHSRIKELEATVSDSVPAQVFHDLKKHSQAQLETQYQLEQTLATVQSEQHRTCEYLTGHLLHIGFEKHKLPQSLSGLVEYLVSSRSPS